MMCRLVCSVQVLTNRALILYRHVSKERCKSTLKLYSYQSQGTNFFLGSRKNCFMLLVTFLYIELDIATSNHDFPHCLLLQFNILSRDSHINLIG